jgi:hypothetical protein
MHPASFVGFCWPRPLSFFSISHSRSVLDQRLGLLGVIRSSWIACDFQALPAEQRMIGLRDARLPSMDTI